MNAGVCQPTLATPDCIHALLGRTLKWPRSNMQKPLHGGGGVGKCCCLSGLDRSLTTQKHAPQEVWHEKA